MADPDASTGPTTPAQPVAGESRPAASARDGAGQAGPSRTQPLDPAAAERGARGSLHVADRVVEKIARRAALEVPGVAPAGTSTGSLGGALGRSYPAADVDLAGTHARVSLQIASEWPHPAPQVASQVREAVTRALHELAAVDADAVAVHVAAVVQPAPPTPQARVR